ncbi:LapA family protein [Hwanghaeella grinnelliae]|uniref:LapA family protein n=1 Tax=Hwanghaeella grinnelliae TaxID=2500179 RepID=A0A437QN76_9PROT|nr:LapA family protein [Hwanghaeella grinnelliae]RVU36004.1 LapA family protein [Hwanghaeella grinnelliae]
MRYLYWLFLLVLAAPAVVFALSNQETVIVQIWPLPFEIPIVTYLLVFIPFLVGFLVGGVIAWFGAGRKRARDARRKTDEAERRVRQLEQELTVARSEQSRAGQSPAEPSRTDQAKLGHSSADSRQTLPARIEDDTADKDKGRAAA